MRIAIIGKGGRRQQPGSPIYVKSLTAQEARDALGAPTR
jgi:hypothetical protein